VIAVFATLLLAGALLIALWTDVRFTDFTPKSVPSAALHVAAAVLAIALAVEAMSAASGTGRALAVISVMAVFVPSLVYLFVSAIWALKLTQRRSSR
jgi:hypothetical protein